MTANPDNRTRRVAVMLPLPLGGAYDYLLPDGIAARPGDYVRVPLGNREVIGVVWGEAEGKVGATRLKPVRARLDAPPMTEAARRFVDWVADYTLAPPGAVLKMALSVPAALDPPATLTAYAAGPLSDLKMTPARRRVLDALAASPVLTAHDLALEAGVGPSVIKGLIAAGALTPVALPPPAAFSPPDATRPGPPLSEAQDGAAAALSAAVEAGAFSVTLLDGVTGSGKTEVYFEAVAAALRRGRQVLVMVPEIALTGQWLGRFEARFGTLPALWHSELTPARRRDTWRAVATGEARVVVGARSALFLPFADLGLIVADEEHDPAYKQEDGVIYNARDMAVVRGRLGAAAVILASATPSLETVVNARAGRYAEVRLPERHGGATLPRVDLIDLRKTPPEKGAWGLSWLSPPLVEAMRATLAEKQQTLLFLNRRGYAPLTLCRACGHRLQCPHCTAWLVEHRRLGRLVCHHCGYQATPPKACPSCGAEEKFAPCGPGIERLAEETRGRFPEARIETIASDTVGGPKGLAELVDRIAARDIDVLIGTQILAKGHHFPWLTLVGAVDADLGLTGGDLRAAERTYQLLDQVSGRAGRGEAAGRVLVQTFDPAHPVMRALAAGDRSGFIETEISQREAAGMPPFGRLAALIVSGTDAARVDEVAARLGRLAPHDAGIVALGPAPAPMALLRGRHRRRLLLKTARTVRLQAVLRDWLARIEIPGAVRVQVDVDPYSFL